MRIVLRRVLTSDDFKQGHPMDKYSENYKLMNNADDFGWPIDPENKRTGFTWTVHLGLKMSNMYVEAGGKASNLYLPVMFSVPPEIVAEYREVYKKTHPQVKILTLSK